MGDAECAGKCRFDGSKDSKVMIAVLICVYGRKLWGCMMRRHWRIGVYYIGSRVSERLISRLEIREVCCSTMYFLSVRKLHSMSPAARHGRHHMSIV